MKTTLIRLGLILGTAAFATAAIAEHEHEHEEHEHWEEHEGRRAREMPETPPSAHAATEHTTPGQKTAFDAYKAECGSCHMAYPRELLPAASWRRLLGSLDNHFGQNAELDAATQTRLLGWLTEGAADASGGGRGRKLARSLDEAAPLRISTTPYILRKHREVSPSVFQRPSIGSRANCVACHGAGAERGYFDEDSVRIPR